MRKIILVLILCPTLALAGLWGRRAQPTTNIADLDTLRPGVSYYYPAGLQAAEDSWYNNGEVGSGPSIFSYGIAVDSISGFDADSSLLTIKAVFGYEDTADTLEYRYGDDNIAEEWTIWSDTTTVLSRTDKGRLVNCGLPAHERRRLLITVQDTLLLRHLKETPARP